MLVLKVKDLINKYDSLKSKGLIKTYDEANTCKDFILPLFEALGWDVTNREEVTAQASASHGRVDYAFCIKGIPKFFLEAKSLKVDLNDTKWAEQTINYAWHKGVVWAVLTDFESIKVFNAEWITKNPNESLFFEIRYDKYLENFEQLSLLSKQAFLENRLDKEAEKWGKKRRKIPVDEKLLSDILKWRNLLATNLRKNHPALLEEELDEAIQRILDRLIFIRTCEDRNIEQITLSPLLREWQNSGKKRRLSQELKSVFRNFDDGYNSQIFSPHLCEDLKINEDVLEIIINGLYETEDRSIRYDFSAIDADVLGSMYEQYLGHILKKTPTRATVKEKHLRRKEMGIYYTPKYIVDYIVKNTVGEMLKEKSYKDAMKVKILDPACGSGSFLIRAFEEMDNYLKEKRSQKGEEFAYFRRMEILNNNLYGVDLDKQAVEIAQLNLLLKALETRQKLPIIKNIRQGNSLISGDELTLFKYFGKNWQEKHPFNWQEQYPEVFKEGGFDVVIGNPPYVSFGLRGVERLEKSLALYLRERFPHSAEYKLSTYTIFIDRAISLLKDGGMLSFIVPDSFLLGRYFSKLRRYILDTCEIKEVILFQKDFWKAGVVGLPVILLVRKQSDRDKRRKNKLTTKLYSSLEAFGRKESKVFSYEQDYFENIAHNRFRLFFDKESREFTNKIEKNSTRLGEIVSIHTGVRSLIGQKNIINPFKKGENWERGLISGSEIGRYQLNWAGNYINIDPKILWSGGWDSNVVLKEKLIMRQTGDSLIAAYDGQKFYHLNNCHSVILRGDKPYSIKFVLAVINSKLMNHYYHLTTLEKGRTMAQTDIETLEQLPIRKIDFSNPKEKKMHDDLVKLVDKMLDLNKQSQQTSEKSDKWYSLKSEMGKTDKKIDEMVYELYGITEKEKKMIEVS